MDSDFFAQCILRILHATHCFLYNYSNMILSSVFGIMMFFDSICIIISFVFTCLVLISIKIFKS